MRFAIAVHGANMTLVRETYSLLSRGEVVLPSCTLQSAGTKNYLPGCGQNFELAPPPSNELGKQVLNIGNGLDMGFISSVNVSNTKHTLYVIPPIKNLISSFK